MEEKGPDEDSHLFLVRLWPGEQEDGEPRWCGKVQHVVSGEARYFTDWPDLISMMLDSLPDTGQEYKEAAIK